MYFKINLEKIVLQRLVEDFILEDDIPTLTVKDLTDRLSDELFKKTSFASIFFDTHNLDYLVINYKELRKKLTNNNLVENRDTIKYCIIWFTIYDMIVTTNIYRIYHADSDKNVKLDANFYRELYRSLKSVYFRLPTKEDEWYER